MVMDASIKKNSSAFVWVEDGLRPLVYVMGSFGSDERGCLRRSVISPGTLSRLFGPSYACPMFEERQTFGACWVGKAGIAD